MAAQALQERGPWLAVTPSPEWRRTALDQVARLEAGGGAVLQFAVGGALGLLIPVVLLVASL